MYENNLHEILENPWIHQNSFSGVYGIRPYFLHNGEGNSDAQSYWTKIMNFCGLWRNGFIWNVFATARYTMAYFWWNHWIIEKQVSWWSRKLRLNTPCFILILFLWDGYIRPCTKHQRTWKWRVDRSISFFYFLLLGCPMLE